MAHFTASGITGLAVHKVGNKSNSEGLFIAQNCIRPDEEITELLSAYFLSPFKTEEYFNLFHESNLELNEIYTYASAIFEDPEQLHEQSVHIARHLYESSNHPKIKSGELYVVHFQDCILDGESLDAIGIFKSENKDTFLKVFPKGDNMEIIQDKGININKLDKGCLIFNTEKEQGYVLMVVDHLNKSSEAHFWMDDFLHVRQRQDSFYQTENTLNLCRDFVQQALPEKFEVSKADQADFLNKSVKFFKENENFDLQDFSKKVFEQSEVIESFNAYKEEHANEHDMEIDDQFEISNSAVKKQSRFFRSVIKLDKNFHIYVHGNKDMMEQGRDEGGKKYYKLFYDEES